jgi:hypothetical protein
MKFRPADYDTGLVPVTFEVDPETKLAEQFIGSKAIGAAILHGLKDLTPQERTALAHLGSRFSHDPGTPDHNELLPPLHTDISPQEAAALHDALGIFVDQTEYDIRRLGMEGNYDQVSFQVLRGEAAQTMSTQLEARFDLPPHEAIQDSTFGFAAALKNN